MHKRTEVVSLGRKKDPYMRPDLLLHDARQSHDILVKELTALFNKLDDTTKFDHFDDKPERLIVPFDLTLQFDMLKMALAAKKKAECLDFLRGMGYFHYDVLRFLKEYADVRGIEIDVTYDNILSLDEEQLTRAMGILEAGIIPLWGDALDAMSKSDLIVEKDVFQILQDNLYRIIDCFLMVDDETTDTDVRKAAESVRVHMLLPILENNDELFKRTKTKKAD